MSWPITTRAGSGCQQLASPQRLTAILATRFLSSGVMSSSALSGALLFHCHFSFGWLGFAFGYAVFFCVDGVVGLCVGGVLRRRYAERGGVLRCYRPKSKLLTGLVRGGASSAYASARPDAPSCMLVTGPSRSRSSPGAGLNSGDSGAFLSGGEETRCSDLTGRVQLVSPVDWFQK